MSDISEAVPYLGSIPRGAGFIIKSAHVCMLHVVPCTIVAASASDYAEMREQEEEER